MKQQKEVTKGVRLKGKNDLTRQLNLAMQEYFRSGGFKDPNLSADSKISFSGFLSDKHLIVMAIRKGIPYSLFSLIQNVTPFTVNDWAKYLDISSKSLLRYQQQNKILKSSHTEKIIELAEVTNLGSEVFGSNEKFKRWLETPNFAVGNLKPADLLMDSYGKEMIMGELTRIEHGVLV